MMNELNLGDVAKALLVLSSFASRNPNVNCGYTAEELSDLNDVVMNEFRMNNLK